MKKVTIKSWFTYLVFALSLSISTNVIAQDLFFSEYIEGSSNNKALEIYNPTSEVILLAGYAFPNVSNAPTTAGVHEFWNVFPDGAEIAPGDVYVIAHSSAKAEMLAAADFTFDFLSNGDDGFALVKGSETDFTVLDWIGDWQADPGDGWSVAGIDLGTKDHTLIRKPGFTGNAVGLASFGTDADNSEWLVKDVDDSSNLGMHTFAEASNEVTVTFRVNTSTFPDTLYPYHVVQIRGGLSGESTGTLATPITWDSGTASMNNVGGDYWELSISGFKPGDVLNYKYWGGVDAENGLVNGSETGWETGENRQLIIPTGLSSSEYELPMAWMGNTSNTSPYLTNKVDSIAIYFRVNVGALIQTNEFNVETDTVGVRGSVSGLDWGVTNLILSKEPASGLNQMYSGALYIPKTALTVGETYEYKFVAKTVTSTELQWETTPNRQLKGVNIDTTLQFQYFSDKKPVSKPLIDVLLNFSVDVGILEGLGYFDAGVGDKVQIRADFNAWSPSDPLTFDPLDFTWALTGRSLKRSVGDLFGYKFFIDYDLSRFDTESINYLPGINSDFGYEEPGITGGGNRVYTITNVAAPETQGPELTFYNGVDPRGLIENPLDVTFSIDMNPAKLHTDPFNPEIDSVYIKFETKYFALVNGFSGDLNKLPLETQERLRFTDDNSDGIYTLTISLATPSPNHMGFTIVYGQLNAESGRTVTNGSGFDAGRRYYQYIRPDVDASENLVWPSTYTLPTLTWAEKDLPWEKALDYDNLATSVDENASVVTGFSLNQNYPNPFNPSTTISFTMSSSQKVKLEVYNLLGQKVMTLVNNQFMTAGQHSVAFNAAKLASGTYMYRLEAGSVSATKSMTLIK